MMGTGTGLAARLRDGDICCDACGKSGCQSPKECKPSRIREGCCLLGVKRDWLKGIVILSSGDCPLHNLFTA